MKDSGWERGKRARMGLVPLLVAMSMLLWLSVPMMADGQRRFDSQSRSMGLSWGWGHSWRHGLPGYGHTVTDLGFVAVHPQMGWFVTDLLELYGEATLLLYHRPEVVVAGGLAGLSARYHLFNDRAWIPFISGGSGLIWRSTEVVEIDRIFNFQLFYGAGLRIVPAAGPSWMVEFRNHHISNAGTAGENLGINAATVLIGVNWILR